MGTRFRTAFRSGALDSGSLLGAVELLRLRVRGPLDWASWSRIHALRRPADIAIVVDGALCADDTRRLRDEFGFVGYPVGAE